MVTRRERARAPVQHCRIGDEFRRRIATVGRKQSDLGGIPKLGMLKLCLLNRHASCLPGRGGTPLPLHPRRSRPSPSRRRLRASAPLRRILCGSSSRCQLGVQSDNRGSMFHLPHNLRDKNALHAIFIDVWVPGRTQPPSSTVSSLAQRGCLSQVGLVPSRGVGHGPESMQLWPEREMIRPQGKGCRTTLTRMGPGHVIIWSNARSRVPPALPLPLGSHPRVFLSPSQAHSRVRDQDRPKDQRCATTALQACGPQPSTIEH